MGGGSRPVRAYAPVGLLVAAAIGAGVLSVGPLVAAIVNSVLLEMSVARAANLPVPQLLPASIDGLGGVALLTLPVLAATGEDPRTRRYCWTVVLLTVGAAAAAAAAHAVYGGGGGTLHLPDGVSLGVSVVPAVSAAMTLHLLVLVMGRVFGLVLRPSPVEDIEQDIQADMSQVEDATTTNVPDRDEPLGVSAPTSRPVPARVLVARLLRRHGAGLSSDMVAARTGVSRRHAARLLRDARGLPAAEGG